MGGAGKLQHNKHHHDQHYQNRQFPPDKVGPSAREPWHACLHERLGMHQNNCRFIVSKTG
jgi:hypothetical protein